MVTTTLGLFSRVLVFCLVPLTVPGARWLRFECLGLGCRLGVKNLTLRVSVSETRHMFNIQIMSEASWRLCQLLTLQFTGTERKCSRHVEVFFYPPRVDDLQLNILHLLLMLSSRKIKGGPGWFKSILSINGLPDPPWSGKRIDR